MWLTLRYSMTAEANSNVVGVLKLLLLLVTADCLDYRGVLAQSNYAQHGDSGNYTTNGLPEETTLDGKVTKTNGIIRHHMPILYSHNYYILFKYTYFILFVIVVIYII